MDKKNIIRIVISLIMLIIGILFESNVNVFWFLAAFIIIGYDVVKDAILNIFSGQIFDENFLMSIASIGAFIIGEYPEALAVMIFYQVGEAFQNYAVNRSRKSIGALMDIKPEVAYLLEEDGSVKKVGPEEVKVNDVVLIKPGEKIPLDGYVRKGAANIDTSALTGESLLVSVSEGEKVISGSINVDGVIEIIVEKEYSESTVSKILELVENASSKKAETEKFITKFARYYTPVVVILALLLFLIPSVIAGASVDDFSKWGYRSLSFLVTSCPCALVISVPMSFFGGIGGASKKGILVKGSNYLEILSSCDTIVFDKTGTLTKGKFVVSKISPAEGVSDEELLYLTAYAEYYSNHPISDSISMELSKLYPEKLKLIEDEAKRGELSKEFSEIPGYGVNVITTQGKVLAGNKKLMLKEGIVVEDAKEPGTIIYTAFNGIYKGYILISDEIKEDAYQAIKELKALNIKKIIMLSGDKKEIAEKVGRDLNIDEVYSELLPEDKVTYIEEIIKKAGDKKVAFIGDGINDAPVLARADVGFAMGALGSDAAIEAADIVIMDDSPMGIVKAIKTSFKTIKIVKSNIIFAIGVKLMILILASLGITNMWAAVFADVGVAFIAILNALRAMNIGD